MREIKFRGKRVDNGEWVFGSYVSDKRGEHILTRAADAGNLKYYSARFDMFAFPVIPETIGQFTGLLDKNGKEIFDGDLISQKNFNGEEYIALYAVVYDGESFCLDMKIGNEKAMLLNEFSSFGHYENNRLRKGEVIGNIHDNHELIGGVE